MDWLKRLGYAPYRSDAPGRSLATMVNEKVYLKLLVNPDVKAVLLSGGGNDLINWNRPAGGGPTAILKNAQGSSTPADWINDRELVAALARLQELFRVFIQDVRGERPRMPIVVHFYDRIVPRTTGKYGYGPWLGNQMDAVGVPRQPQQLRNDIAAILIDRANDMCRSVAAAQAVTYVDLRGIVGTRW
jgi:hypothetical protein